MTLIYCPACENGCSPRAAECPKCGHPLAAPVAHLIEPARMVQTIEQTSKGWKLTQLAGAAMMVVGLSSCLVSMQDVTAGQTEPEGAQGMLIGMVGIMILLFGRLGAWWNHG